NMQTGIRTHISAGIQAAGRIVLNARLFGDMIRRMPDDMIVFSADDKLMVHLSCGDASFDILGLAADDYPDLPEVDDQFSVSLSQKTLRAMIDETLFAVSTNESRPVHTGSLFEINDKGLTIVSVDGFRLALRREPLEKIDGGAFSFVAPGSALSEVEKICGDTDDLITLIQGNRHLLFEAGSTQLICRRLEGDFLDYKNAIPRSNSISVIVDTKNLLESLDRVSVVISEKLKSPVRCVFEEDRVLLSAKTGNGEANDVCRLSGDGAGLEIGFNNRYLMEALRNAPAETVKMELNTSISPCIIVPTEGEDNFLYMVLPVRLKAQ
ncbi:MAG: DNA polymerase III subunit beta, partial [Clostridiales bacterium]|nr:DNA polymerase III subunit beta [Clostridiales bacterium]